MLELSQGWVFSSMKQSFKIVPEKKLGLTTYGLPGGGRNYQTNTQLCLQILSVIFLSTLARTQIVLKSAEPPAWESGR